MCWSCDMRVKGCVGHVTWGSRGVLVMVVWSCDMKVKDCVGHVTWGQGCVGHVT